MSEQVTVAIGRTQIGSSHGARLRGFSLPLMPESQPSLRF